VLCLFGSKEYFLFNAKTKQTAKSSCSFSDALVVLTSMPKRNSPQRSAALFQTRWYQIESTDMGELLLSKKPAFSEGAVVGGVMVKKGDKRFTECRVQV